MQQLATQYPEESVMMGGKEYKQTLLFEKDILAPNGQALLIDINQYQKEKINKKQSSDKPKKAKKSSDNVVQLCLTLEVSRDLKSFTRGRTQKEKNKNWKQLSKIYKKSVGNHVAFRGTLQIPVFETIKRFYSEIKIAFQSKKRTDLPFPNLSINEVMLNKRNKYCFLRRLIVKLLFRNERKLREATKLAKKQAPTSILTVQIGSTSHNNSFQDSGAGIQLKTSGAIEAIPTVSELNISDREKDILSRLKEKLDMDEDKGLKRARHNIEVY